MKKKIRMIARIVFGILLLGAGLTGLLGSMPPMQYPEPANKFMIALVDTGYMIVIISSLKVLVGVSMLINRFVPLALVVFMSISVNMVLFHAFLDIKSILPTLVIGFLNVYLLFGYIESYKPLLKAKN
ncbi:DoxX family protein [Paenibacillus prosopidis]|uniref:DoxX family protein n=1 Tax=Paenibacillus prosopidis TaxID=630520 RepID=UPI000DF40268|nr:DoxX family protein [Paenibacillus prosopidis]